MVETLSLFTLAVPGRFDPEKSKISKDDSFICTFLSVAVEKKPDGHSI